MPETNPYFSRCSMIRSKRCNFWRLYVTWNHILNVIKYLDRSKDPFPELAPLKNIGNLTEQSHTGRSSLGKLINWMHFFFLKPLNWFFQFSWKEKTCVLSAVSIWHENFEERIYIRTQKPFFRVFHHFLRNSLKGPKKCQKTQYNSQYDIFLRDFYTRCSPQIKDAFFFSQKFKILIRSL